MSEAANQPAAPETTQAAAGAITTEAKPAEAVKPQVNEPAKPAPAKAEAEAKPAVTTEAVKAEPPKEEVVDKPKAEAEKPAEGAKSVPEKYELKLPKNSHLTKEHVDNLMAHAKERGMSNEDAQKLLDRESQAVSGYVADQTKRQGQLRDTWYEQVKNDKELGGDNFKRTSENARRVVDRFASEHLKQELNKTGLGNHPELLRMMSKIGEAMADDKFVLTTERPAPKKSTADVLYPSSATKEN
jgi:hypothetical protein